MKLSLTSIPNSIGSLGVKQSRITPAIAKLSARDFKVCEDCGGPAVQHPRFEMAQIISGEKLVLCCNCLHEAAFPAPTYRAQGELRVGDQLWECRVCHEIRAWGIAQPWDPYAKPVLRCGACQVPTRHTYAGIRRRTHS